jgi:hypothetical protein
MIYVFSAMNELLFENYLVPKVTYGIDGLFSLYKNQPNFAKDKSTAMVISLGTIHILRKHFYSTKINLTFKFFTETGFFVKRKEFLFQHYILTKFSCCGLKLLEYKEKMLKKLLRLIKQKCFRYL